MQIKLKNSVVQDSAPSASDLPEVGELAVNGNINSIGGFMRASDNSIVKIFGPGSVTTPTATTTVSGIAELATNAETTTGSASNRVVTPAGLNAVTVAERSTSNSTYLALAGGTLTGVVAATAGSNSAPSIHFGDSDSGIFGGTNTVSLAAGGTTRLTADTGVSVVGTLAVTGAITSTSDLTIADKIIHSGDTDTAIRFPSADTVSIETSSSERARVDSTGRFLVGTSTARTNFFNAASTHTPRLQIESTNNDNGRAALGLIYGKTNASGPYIVMAKHRSNTVGDNTVVQSGDETGIIAFQGSDGTQFVDAARIQGFVDGTPGADDMPGRLVFSTTADGASSPTDRLTIDSAGAATFTGNITSSAGEIVTANGSIVANKGTNNQVLIGHDGSIEISRNNGGGFIDFRSNTSEDHDARIQENAGGFNLSGNVNIASGLDVTGAITGTGDMTIDTNTLHVDSSNNRIGIGTTSPKRHLHIHEPSTATVGLMLTNTATGNSNDSQGFQFKVGSDGTANIDQRENAPILFLTNASERMRLDSSGNVGIGTTNPTSTLHLDASGGAVLVLQRISSNASNKISLSHDGTNGTLDSTNATLFRNGGGEKMRIDSSGRVGIGHDTPSSFSSGASTLVLNTNSGNCGLTISTSAADQIGSIFFAEGASSTGDGRIRYEHANNAMAFTTADTEHMRIDSSGRVGIGTTSPEGVGLDITKSRTNAYGATSDNRNLAHLIARNGSDAAGRFASISMISGGGTQAEGSLNLVQTGSYAGDLTFKMRSAVSTWAEAMRITSAGNVGIGTTSPDALLHLSGTSPFIRFTDTVDSTHYAHIGHSDASIFVIDADAANAHAGSGIQLKVDNSTVMFLKDGGNVGIGTTSPSAGLHISTTVQGLDVETSNPVTAEFKSTNASGGYLAFQMGDNGANIGYLGDSGQLVSTGGANDNLALRADNGIELAVGVTRKVRIDSDGMKFGTDTAAANGLGDYEEGTFTPTYTVGAGGGNMVNNASYLNTAGSYTKVGRLVTFSLRMQLASGFTVIGGHVVINGLPFTSVNLNGAQCGATFGYRSALGSNAVELYIPGNSSQIQFYDTSGSTYYAGAGGNNFASTLHIWGSYHAA